MADALIAPTYAEAAQLHRHFKLLFGSAAALDYLLASTPAPTGAQLQAWLGTAANLTDFQRLISTPTGAAALCAAGTAMAAVVASSTAMAAVVASNTAMAAVAASSTAMAVVAASSTAMAVVAASSTAMPILLDSAIARTACYDSTTAWNALAAAAEARAALSAVAVVHNTSSVTHVYPTGVSDVVRVALVQQKTGNGSYPSTAGANADTYTTASTVYIDRYVRVTGLTHHISYASTSSSVRYVVMQ